MFGRDAEVAAIEALVRAARGGRSGALIVSGEPGIGKTAVLARAREAAGDALVLEATGSEAESHLAFAGLADLVGPVLGHIDEIPGPQAVAMRGALALGPPRPGDRFTAYAATLSLLAAAAERRPVVCIVDDAQWLDAESFEAIQFAGRRLGAEGVALLIGVREGANPVTGASALPHLRLTGLDDGAATRLLVLHAAVAPAADVQRALVDGAAGNPLALIELASGLDEAQLTGRSPLPDPLPVGRHLSRALLRPLDDLPESTRRALLVASAGDGSAAYLGEALRADGRSFADLEPAERAGVVGVGPSRVLFSHPLVRAAVYQAAPAPDRRSAHAAHAVAAERVNEAGALGRRAWHLALASAGPDEAAAAELERAARDAVGRNAHAAATEALEAAGRLSPDDTARGARLLAAAGSAVASGAFSRAAILLDQVIALAAEPSQALEAEVLRAYVEMLGGSARRAIELMVAAADRLEEVAPAAAASLLAQASMPAQIRGDARTAMALSARAAALAVDAPPAVRAVVNSATASAAAYRSRPIALADETEERLAREAATGDPQAYFWAVAVVHLRMLEERYQEALERLGGFIGAARLRSTPSALAYPLTSRAELLLRLGRFQEALANASEAAQISLETGQHMVGSYAFGTLARVEALLGRSADCRAHAARGVADIAKSEADILVVYSGSALGLLELADGRLGEALGHLLSCEHRARGLGRPHPLMVPFVQDLIETRIRLGQVNEATEELDAFAAQAAAIGAAWPRAAAERCRGLLAGDDAFEEHFARALSLHRLTPTPFERARTELCLGERRRRARRLREAREPLGAALATFEALGAEPWAGWARRELRAAGARPSEARAASVGSLTPQELRIALAVAGGATNREAAASLLISPKTVEYHLARIYTKLGIRSRSELARRMARETSEILPSGGGT